MTADEQTIEEIIEEELAQEPAAVEPIDCNVTIGDQIFELVEPTTGIVLRIINSISRIGMRGEKIALRSLSGIRSSATWSMILFGILAAFQPADLIEFGSAVLQFDDPKEGRKFLKDQGNRLKIAPLVKAAFINVALSDDLVEIVDNFFAGLAIVQQSNLVTSVKNLLGTGEPSESSEE